MGFIWWALPTMLARQGVALAEITLLTSTATLPWVLKFLAGPVIDAGLARGLSLRRWILACQCAMVISLAPLAFIDWGGGFAVLTTLLVGHAVFAAAQDVGIDTLAIRSVPTGDLGRINGWMQGGMLAGRAAVASGALLLGAVAGQAAVIGALVVIIALPMILLLVSVHDPARAPVPLAGSRQWLAILAGRAGLLGLAVALTAGAGFEFLSVAVGPLLVEQGVADGPISLFFGLLAPGGLIAGAALSARFSDRIGTHRATAAGIIVIGMAVGGVAGLVAAAAPALAATVPMLAAVYVAIGFFTAASYALFMRLSQGAFSATRFALFMALTNGCEAWAGYAGGQLKVPLGYPLTLLVLVAVSLVALPLLRRLGNGQA